MHKSELRPLFSKRSPDNSKSRYRRREVDCVVCFKLCWRPETDARLACKGRGRGRGGLTGQTQDFCTRKWSLFPLYVILFQSMILYSSAISKSSMIVAGNIHASWGSPRFRFVAACFLLGVNLSFLHSEKSKCSSILKCVCVFLFLAFLQMFLETFSEGVRVCWIRRVRENYDSRPEDDVLPENQSSEFKDDMLSRTSSISSSQLSAFSYEFKL